METHEESPTCSYQGNQGGTLRWSRFIGVTSDVARSGSKSLLVDLRSFADTEGIPCGSRTYRLPDVISQLLFPVLDLSSAEPGDTIIASFWIYPMDFKANYVQSSGTVRQSVHLDAYLQVNNPFTTRRFEFEQPYFDEHRNTWQNVELDLSSFAGVLDETTISMRFLLRSVGWSQATQEIGGESNLVFAIDDLSVEVTSPQ